MKELIKPFVFFLMFFLIVSCNTGSKALVQEKPNPDRQNLKELYAKDAQNYTKRVLADRCRIVGKIKAIDTTRFLDDPEAPCGKAPCYATIIIDQILGYGSGFSPKLYKGQELEVNFKFTLAPTNEIAPDMQLGLPGLKIGNEFIADLESLPVLGQKQSDYVIYRYELKE